MKRCLLLCLFFFLSYSVFLKAQSWNCVQPYVTGSIASSLSFTGGGINNYCSGAVSAMDYQEDIYYFEAFDCGEFCFTIESEETFFSGGAALGVPDFLGLFTDCNANACLDYDIDYSDFQLQVCTFLDPGDGVYVVVDDGDDNDDGAFDVFYSLIINQITFALCDACGDTNQLECNSSQNIFTSTLDGNSTTTFTHEINGCDAFGEQDGIDVLHEINVGLDPVNLEIRVQNMSTNLDLFLYSDCDFGPINCIASSATNSSVESIIIQNATGSYYLVVDSRSFDGPIDYNIQVLCEGLCDNLDRLSCTNPAVSGTTSGAANNFDVSCGSLPGGWSGGDQFIEVDIDADGSYTFEISSGDDNLDIFLFDECDQEACPIAFDPTFGNSFQANLNDGIYYLLVDGFLGAEGSYTVSLSCGLNCAGSDDIDCGTSLTNQTTNDGNSVTQYTCGSSTIEDYEGDERIYRITADITGEYIFILYDESDGRPLDMFLLSECDPNQCIASSTETTSSFQDIIEINLVAGETYYLVVDGPNSGSSNFDLDVICTDYCSIFYPTSSNTWDLTMGTELFDYSITEIIISSPFDGSNIGGFENEFTFSNPNIEDFSFHCPDVGCYYVCVYYYQNNNPGELLTCCFKYCVQEPSYACSYPSIVELEFEGESTGMYEILCYELSEIEDFFTAEEYIVLDSTKVFVNDVEISPDAEGRYIETFEEGVYEICCWRYNYLCNYWEICCKDVCIPYIPEDLLCDSENDISTGGFIETETPGLFVWPDYSGDNSFTIEQGNYFETSFEGDFAIQFLEPGVYNVCYYTFDFELICCDYLCWEDNLPSCDEIFRIQPNIDGSTDFVCLDASRFRNWDVGRCLLDGPCDGIAYEPLGQFYNPTLNLQVEGNYQYLITKERRECCEQGLCNYCVIYLDNNCSAFNPEYYPSSGELHLNIDFNEVEEWYAYYDYSFLIEDEITAIGDIGTSPKYVCLIYRISGISPGCWYICCKEIEEKECIDIPYTPNCFTYRPLEELGNYVFSVSDAINSTELAWYVDGQQFGTIEDITLQALPGQTTEVCLEYVEDGICYRCCIYICDDNPYDCAAIQGECIDPSDETYTFSFTAETGIIDFWSYDGIPITGTESVDDVTVNVPDGQEYIYVYYTECISGNTVECCSKVCCYPVPMCPDTCYTNCCINEDLTWLNELIDEYNQLYIDDPFCTAIIEQCNYNGQCVYDVTPPACIFDLPNFVYDCSGGLLFGYGGLLEVNLDLADQLMDCTRIWESESGYLDECEEDPNGGHPCPGAEGLCETFEAYTLGSAIANQGQWQNTSPSCKVGGNNTNKFLEVKDENFVGCEATYDLGVGNSRKSNIGLDIYITDDGTNSGGAIFDNFDSPGNFFSMSFQPGGNTIHLIYGSFDAFIPYNYVYNTWMSLDIGIDASRNTLSVSIDGSVVRTVTEANTTVFPRLTFYSGLSGDLGYRVDNICTYNCPDCYESCCTNEEVELTITTLVDIIDVFCITESDAWMLQGVYNGNCVFGIRISGPLLEDESSTEELFIYDCAGNVIEQITWTSPLEPEPVALLGLNELVWDCANGLYDACEEDCHESCCTDTDLSWLEDIIANKEMECEAGCYSFIQQCTYQGACVYVEHPSYCVLDLPSTVYDCNGDVLFYYGGFAEPDDQNLDLAAQLMDCVTIWDCYTPYDPCDDCPDYETEPDYDTNCQLISFLNMGSSGNGSAYCSFDFNGLGDINYWELVDEETNEIIEIPLSQESLFSYNEFLIGKRYIICVYYTDENGCLQRCCLKIYIPVNCNYYNGWLSDPLEMEYEFAFSNDESFQFISWWDDIQIGTVNPIGYSLEDGVTTSICCLLYDPINNCYIICCQDWCPQDSMDCTDVSMSYDTEDQAFLFDLNTSADIVQWYAIQNGSRIDLGSNDQLVIDLSNTELDMTEEAYICIRYLDDDGCWKTCCKRICDLIDPLDACDYIVPNYLGEGLQFQFEIESPTSISRVQWKLHIPGTPETIDIGMGDVSDALDFESLQSSYPSLDLSRVCISIEYYDEESGCYKVCCACLCLVDNPGTCSDLQGYYNGSLAAPLAYSFVLDAANPNNIRWFVNGALVPGLSDAEVRIDFEDLGYSFEDDLQICVRYYDLDARCFRYCCIDVCLVDPHTSVCDFVLSLNEQIITGVSFDNDAIWTVKDFGIVGTGPNITIDLSEPTIAEFSDGLDFITVCQTIFRNGCWQTCCEEVCISMEDVSCDALIVSFIDTGDDYLFTLDNDNAIIPNEINVQTPSGSIQNAVLGEYVNAESGTYTFTAIYITTCGDTIECSESLCVARPFDCKPISFQIDENDSNTFTFFHAIPDGISYQWDFGDGNSSNDPSQSVSHTFTSGNEVHTVCLSVSNECEIVCVECIEVGFGILTVDYIAEDPRCANTEDGSIALFISGAIPPVDIQWSTGLEDETRLLNIGAGVYNVVVTDNTGLSVTLDISLEAPPLPELSISTGLTTCGEDNGTASVSFANPELIEEITWLPSGITGDVTTLSGLGVGTDYALEILDVNGCIQTVPFEIRSDGYLPIYCTNVQFEFIENNVVEFSQFVFGGVDYSWDFGDGSTDQNSAFTVQHEFPDGPGSYPVCLTVTDSCGAICETCVLINVDGLSVSYAIDQPSCIDSEDGSITLAIFNVDDYDVIWSTGDENVNPLTGLGAGLYTATITDSDGNEYIIEAELIAPVMAQISFSLTGSTCDAADGMVAIDILNNVEIETYTWMPSGTITTEGFIDGLAPGEYSVEIQDENGCTMMVSFVIEDLSGFSFSLGEDLSICVGDVATIGDIELDNIENIVWTKDGQELETNAIPLSVDEGGVYVLSIENDVGCITSDEILIIENSPSIFDNIEFIEGFIGEQITLDIPGASSVLWTSTLDLSCTNCLNPILTISEDGIINASAFDDNGCSADIEYNVTAIITDLVAPNFISPNGDTRNDALIFEGIQVYPENELRVFNRWGELMYSTEDYQNDWEGVSFDEELPDGVYYYILRYGKDDSSENELKSDLLIIRNN